MQKQAAAVATRQAEDLQGRLAAANDAIKVGHGRDQQMLSFIEPRSPSHHNIQQSAIRHQTFHSKLNQ